jgi:hypothetical protein
MEVEVTVIVIAGDGENIDTRVIHEGMFDITLTFEVLKDIAREYHIDINVEAFDDPDREYHTLLRYVEEGLAEVDKRVFLKTNTLWLNINPEDFTLPEWEEE